MYNFFKFFVTKNNCIIKSIVKHNPNEGKHDTRLYIEQINVSIRIHDEAESHPRIVNVILIRKKEEKVETVRGRLPNINQQN